MDDRSEREATLHENDLLPAADLEDAIYTSDEADNAGKVPDEEEREAHDYAVQKIGSVTQAIYKTRNAGTSAKRNIGKETEGINGRAREDEAKEVLDEGESLLVQGARSAGDESLPSGRADSTSRNKSVKLDCTEKYIQLCVGT